MGYCNTANPKHFLPHHPRKNHAGYFSGFSQRAEGFNASPALFPENNINGFPGVR